MVHQLVYSAVPFACRKFRLWVEVGEHGYKCVGLGGTTGTHTNPLLCSYSTHRSSPTGAHTNPSLCAYRLVSTHTGWYVLML